jgi:transposase InsO family protein
VDQNSGSQPGASEGARRATGDGPGLRGKGPQRFSARRKVEIVLRLMREYQFLAPQCRGCSPGPRVHDGTITTTPVNDMGGTDMTATITTEEGQAAIFFAVDHCSMECVGLHAAKRDTRFEALEPLKQGVREYCGAFAPQVAQGLTLRQDHGSQYMSHDFQEEIAFLGINSSPAFVRAPEGNGYALCPHPQRKPALGEDLPHRGGTAPGPPGVQMHGQRKLDHPTPRLSDPCSGTPETTSGFAPGRLI